MSEQPIKAFPKDEWDEINEVWRSMGGMDLRDYFAAKAMQGMLANPVIFSNGNNKFNGENLETCYQIADAMMEVRD